MLTNVVPDSALAIIKEREGFKDHVYLDSRRLPTAGYGHLLLPSEIAQYPVGTRLPADLTEEWLQRDSLHAYNAALSQAAQLQVDDEQFIAALTSVCFQLGSNWTAKFPHTWKHILNGEYEVAAAGLESSDWFRETPVRVQDFQQALRSLIQ